LGIKVVVSRMASIRARLEEIVKIMGGTVNLLMRVIGVFRTLETLGGSSSVMEKLKEDARNTKEIDVERVRLKKKVLYRILMENVVSVHEILKEFGKEGLEILQDLYEDGDIVPVKVNKRDILVAVVNDGTLSLKTLSKREMIEIILDCYANRSKGLSYAQVRKILQQIRQQRARRA